MAYIDLSPLSIPTPQPYSKADATRNNENFYYVMLQVLDLLKAAAFKIPDKNEAVTETVKALQDLQYNGETLDLGPLQITFTGKTISVIGP